MNSGSLSPANPVDSPQAQIVYDAIVKLSGCNSSSNTLHCLRNLPYDQFANASNSIRDVLGYNAVAFPFNPRPDGVVLPDAPDALARSGRYAPVPFIIGDQEDEGTLFAQSQTNLSTNDDLVSYVKAVIFPGYTKARVQGLVKTYPDNPADGSPFRTGNANVLYPQFKRLAALLGDIAFTITRRIFLADHRRVYPNVPSWSYLATYYHGTPNLGTYHGSDVLVVYGQVQGHFTSSIQAYYLSFFNTMDPNAQIPKGMRKWPQWGSKQVGDLLVFGNETNTLMADDFRNATYTYLINPGHVLRV